MPLYLSGYRGAGIHGDPYLPKHADEPGWAASDLRPDQTVLAGLCLLYSPGPLTSAVGLEQIADERRETLSVERRDRIYNALGKNFAGSDNRVDTILADLLFGRQAGPAVQPSTLRSVKEVVFQGQAWASESVTRQRVSELDPSDNFNRANETPLAGNWTLLSGSQWEFNLIGNEILITGDTGSLPTAYRWNANAFGPDQYSQCTANVLGTDSDWGSVARMSSSAYSYYFAAAYAPGEALSKWVAGVFTQVASITTTNVAVGDTLRIECEGSTLKYILNGATKGSSTDTSHTSGSPGIVLVRTNTRLDNWAGGDIPKSFPPSRRDPMKHMVVR